MARMRSMKPEYYSDQEIAEELPGRDGRDARLLYPGLWGLADEHGRLRADPRWIKGQLFAYDDDMTPEVIDGLIDMIAATGRAVRYRVGTSRYLFLPKLAKHQRLEPHKVESRLPNIDQGEVEEVRRTAPTSTSENRASSSEPRAASSERDANPSETTSAKHVAGSREHVAGSREHVAGSRRQVAGARAREEPPPDDDGPPGLAEELLAEWKARLKRPVGDVVVKVGLWIHDALRDGHTPDDIRETLRRWDSLPRKGPGLLPSLIHEVANGPRPGTDLARASPKRAQQPSVTEDRARQAKTAGANVQAMFDQMKGAAP